MRGHPLFGFVVRFAVFAALVPLHRETLADVRRLFVRDFVLQDERSDEALEYDRQDDILQNVHDHTSLRPRPRPHDFKTAPTTKGWRFALMPPWASRHIGGSGQYPRYTDARKGRPWAAQTAPQLDNDSTTRLKHFIEHLHGSGASSSSTYMVAEPVR